MKFNEAIIHASLEYDKQKEFNTEMHSLCSLYSDNVDKKSDFPFLKLIIWLHPLEEECNQNIEFNGEIFEYHLNYDFDKYWKLSEDEKKKEILETLHNNVCMILKSKNHNIDPFESAYKNVKELNYQNSRFYKKQIYNPNKTHKAQIYYEFGLNEIEIYVVFFDKKDSEIDRKILLKTFPDDYFLKKAIGKYYWQNDNTFILKDKYNKEQYVATL